MSLITALSGVRTMMEGMAACVALHLGRELTGPVRVDHIFGRPGKPALALIDVKNPALHGFWDLWADGIDGLNSGYEVMQAFGDSLSSSKVEILSLDKARLSDQSISLIEWLGSLIIYLIRMADRDAREEIENPKLWPLQPFFLPE